MLMAAFFYASLYLAVRQSIKNLSVAEVAFFRAGLAAAMMLPWVMRSGLSCLQTKRSDCTPCVPPSSMLRR